MLMRLAFGACLFGLGYYFGREATLKNINQTLAEAKAGESSPMELSGNDQEAEYDETNGGGRIRT